MLLLSLQNSFQYFENASVAFGTNADWGLSKLSAYSLERLRIS